MKKILLATVVFVITVISCFGQVLGDYRSIGDVNFTSTTNWQKWNGTSWVAVSSAPTSVPAANTITISAGHTATTQVSNTVLNGTLAVYGVLELSKNFTTRSIHVYGSSGKIFYNCLVIQVNVKGDFRVESGGTYDGLTNIDPSFRPRLIIYGDFYNFGNFDVGNTLPIIAGNFISPSPVSWNGTKGKIISVGDISGVFNFTGSASNRIYSINPNASLNITNTSGNSVSPNNYSDLQTSESSTIVNLVNSSFNACMSEQSTTWNGVSWNNGVPTTAKSVVIAANYSANSIAGCSLTVNTGVTLTIQNSTYINIVNSITNNGNIIVEDGGDVAQIYNNTGYFTGNAIVYKRKTTPLKQFDYTYWSSPMTNSTLGQLATNSLFYSFNTSLNDWVSQVGGAAMKPGVGYIGRSPNGLDYSTPQIVETNFIGIPNNGDISIPIIKGAGKYNLMGNPYPSALNADLFILGNSGVINGTIYLWTHNTAITNNNYTANDYSKYNLTGGVGSASGGAVPNGYIASGQGFFIEANTTLSNGTYNAVCKNTMRKVAKNTQFFKTLQPIPYESNEYSIEKNRIWLSLSSQQGAYSQMLIGYVEGASNDFDSLYDGKIFPSGNSVSVYSVLGYDLLSIQGRSLPFSSSDVVPIGYETTLNGELIFNLDNFDGLFGDQNIYLLDKVTGICHNLKEGAFTFTTISGTFNDRFELRYTEQSLGLVRAIHNTDDTKVISEDHHIAVLSPGDLISKVEIYDILGKLLFSESDLETEYFKSNTFSLANQVLIVKVAMNDGEIITRKTIIH